MQPGDSTPLRYDYTQAGFDGFLNRSIDSTGQSGLGSPAQIPPSRAVAFDRQQISGAFGDSIQIGNILLNGVEGRISIFDGENEVVRLGELDG